MSGPVRPPLTVETVDGATSGRPITKIKVSNGDLTISGNRSEEHTSELQSPVPISYAVFCLKKKKTKNTTLKISQTKPKTTLSVKHEVPNVITRLLTGYETVGNALYNTELIHSH